MSPSVATIRTEGLGDSTYVLVHEGIALVVDPQRDIDRFEAVLSAHDAELRLVLETHLHNDYVSGGRDLARRHDGELVMPAGAAPVFRHRPAFHLEDIDLGLLSIRPIHTPGHTPEHVSYLVLVDGRQVAVFSGGSLLVGTAGRTDLLGMDRAETLARLQHGSVHRLAALDGAVELYPTHGAGSFCTASGTPGLSSTIAAERETNPVLAYEDVDAFVKGQLSGLAPYPAYYRHMGRLNLTGLEAPRLEAPLLGSVPDGALVIDARPRERFAAGHVPGSLGIELRDSFGTWVGWLTEIGSASVLVLEEDQDAGEAMRQLARIGYDGVLGVVREDASFDQGYRTAGVEEFAAAVAEKAQVLDVRSPDEWEQGIVEGSVLQYLPDLARQTATELDAERPVWILCGTGYRSSIAGSILQARGFDPIVLADGGATEVLAATSKR